MKIAQIFFSLCLLSPSMLLGQTRGTTLKSLMNRFHQPEIFEAKDFAPNLFRILHDLETYYQSKWKPEEIIPDTAVVRFTRQIEFYQKAVLQSQKALRKAYPLRNAAMQLEFIRHYDPKGIVAAEAMYQNVIHSAEIGHFYSLSEKGQKAFISFEAIINGAKRNLTEKGLQDRLNQIESNIRQDMDILRQLTVNNITYNQLEKINSIYLRTGQSGLLSNDLGGTYHAPPPDIELIGPNPTTGIGFTERTNTTVTLIWGDVSTDEIGNIIQRSTNLNNWIDVEDVGPIDKLTFKSYTDDNLQPDTKYFYRVITWNNQGANPSSAFSVYTKVNYGIELWRFQIEVKVADFSGAGTDNLLNAWYAETGESIGTWSYLDYGVVDFQDSSLFTYDLNLEHINDLGDLTNFRLQNIGNPNDPIYIESIRLLANNHEIFSIYFGSSKNSAKRLGYGAYFIEKEDLRNHPSWNSFLEESSSNDRFNLPPIANDDNRVVLKVSNETIVSIIESFISNQIHLSNAFPSDVAWGKLHGKAVEVKQLSKIKLKVDLDLEDVNWSFVPDAELDVDFEINLSKSCNSDTLILQLESTNFTSDEEFDTWVDIASLGISEGIDYAIDYFIGKCVTIPKINKTFEVILPPGYNCEDIEVYFNQAGDLIICCIQL